MKISFGNNYKRCLTKFTKLPIIPKLGTVLGDDTTKYLIFSKDKRNILGSFSMNNDGFIHDFKLRDGIRRKQDACNAILSVREFVINKAKELNLDFVKFQVSFWDNNHVGRLYKKLGADLTHVDDYGKYFIGVINPAKKADIIKRIEDSIRIPIDFIDKYNSFIKSVK